MSSSKSNDTLIIDTPNKERFSSAFSVIEKGVVGFGDTKKKTQQTVYVFVREKENGQYEVQYLNDHNVPTGETKIISEEELLQSYTPEPEFYMKTVLPAIKNLQKTIAKGDRHRKNGETYSAEMEYSNALEIDEHNIKATFGLGLTLIDRKELDKAHIVFSKLVRLKGAFKGRHKHLFNEFGIKLRKNKMYSQATKFYARAHKFTKTDENLYYNLGRVLYEQGKPEKAMKFVKKALSLNPEFVEGREFLTFLQKKVQ